MIDLDLPSLSRWAHKGPGELVILDNRDSFVFNLAHRFAELGAGAIVVTRSEQISLEQLRGWRPRALVLSPGPGHPRDAGICEEVVLHLSGQLPILGVCLGHQAIATAFGGVVEPNHRPMHGMASAIEHDDRGLFAGLPQGFAAARYHSLVAREPLPAALEVSARSQGWVMGLRHREHATFGLQFHPESVLSPTGYALLQAFLDTIR